MGIQINGQTDTISATDGSLNIGGTVTVNVTGDATGLTGTPNVNVGVLTAASAVISGNLQVDGTTTTLDTLLTEVDKLEVGANNTTVGVAITQSGTGDILNLYDGSTEVFTVTDGGSVGIGTDNPGSGNILSVHGRTILGQVATGDATTKAEMISQASLRIKPHVTSTGALNFAQINNGDGIGLQFTNGSGTANWDIALQPFGGNIGIGLTNPQNLLHIKSGTSGASSYDARYKLILENSGEQYIGFYNNDNSYSGIRFNNTTTNLGTIDYYYTQNYLYFYSNGGYAFSTKQGGGTVERLRITSAGNIGIGTTNPISELMVENATQSHITVKTSGSNMAKFGSKGNDVYIGGTAGAANIIFKRNIVSIDHPADSGTETLRITSGGALNQNGTAGLSYFKGSTEYIFGSNTSSPPSGGGEALVQIHQNKSRNTLSVIGYQDNAGGPILAMISSRSATVGTLGSVTINGDELGGIRFGADVGTSTGVGYGAIIRSTATATATSNGVAADIRFSTSPDSTGTGTQERLRITASGQINMSGLDGTFRNPSMTNIQRNGLILFPSSSNGDSDYSDNHMFSIAQSQGNWLEGETGTNHSSWGPLWTYHNGSGTYQKRAGIHYDHRSSEQFKFWSSYGDFVFKTDNARSGNETAETCDTEALRIKYNGNIGIDNNNPDERLDIGGAIKYTGNNCESIEFAATFSSGTTHTIASLSNTSQDSVAVATIEYQCLYSYVSVNNACGVKMAATRRVSSNTAWSDTDNQNVGGPFGSDTSIAPNFFWDAGVLKITTGSSVQCTGRIRVTVRNMTITRNYTAG